MKTIILLLCLIVLNGCAQFEKEESEWAKRILIDAGYHDIQILTSDVSDRCTDNDVSDSAIFSVTFMALKKDGKDDWGRVCASPVKTWIFSETDSSNRATQKLAEALKTEKPPAFTNPCHDAIGSDSPSAFKVLSKLNEVQQNHYDEDAGGVHVAVDNFGIVYVAEGVDHTILKIMPNGETTVLAGLAGVAGNVDGVGSQARFGDLAGIAVDDHGWVYVTQFREGVVRKISPFGKVSTLAGSAENRENIDGQGVKAGFGGPAGIAVDRKGNVYVADRDNDTIRKIARNGMVSTFAGRPNAHSDYNNVETGAALFLRPSYLAFDRNSGMLYVTEGGWVKYLHRVSQDGEVSTLAHIGTTVGWSPNSAKALIFNSFGAIAVDPFGNVYIATGGSQGVNIFTIDGVLHAYPSATITTHAGDGNCTIIQTDIVSLAASSHGLVAIAGAYTKKGVDIAPLPKAQMTTTSRKY